MSSETEPVEGALVRVRQRTYLVQGLIRGEASSPIVQLACIDDDAAGQRLDVIWNVEVDAKVIPSGRSAIREGVRPDAPKTFAAYLHALRWGCVTSTDPSLFQASLRAGIVPKSYQLEPLRKALALPRVNLFIADDVGLGKTIEAGLVLQELLLRQRVQRVVIVGPASVVPQWQGELAQRFGLPFVVMDRAYVNARRRERGFGVNPWSTHRHFLISHALFRDEDYLVGLREWLGTFAPGSLLILDEAHVAAPASESKYAIDTQITRAVRDIAKRFEHRLFLSATPHNGHALTRSESWGDRGTPCHDSAARVPALPIRPESEELQREQSWRALRSSQKQIATHLRDRSRVDALPRARTFGLVGGVRVLERCSHENVRAGQPRQSVGWVVWAKARTGSRATDEGSTISTHGKLRRAAEQARLGHFPPVGLPRVTDVLHPGLPQIRTCPIRASGSSWRGASLRFAVNDPRSR